MPIEEKLLIIAGHVDMWNLLVELFLAAKYIGPISAIKWLLYYVQDGD